MTSKRRKPSIEPAAALPPNVQKQDYLDEDGIARRVILPLGETDAAMGIPISLDLSSLYDHMPESFQRELYEALHAQGLVEASDYFKPGAAERFKAAMLSVIRHDFLSVQALAHQEL